MSLMRVAALSRVDVKLNQDATIGMTGQNAHHGAPAKLVTSQMASEATARNTKRLRALRSS